MPTPDPVVRRENEIAAAFEALWPELLGRCRAFAAGRPDPEETLQEMSAFSWWNFSQAARNGFQPNAAQLAFVARRRARSGRTLGNAQSLADVLSIVPRQKRRVRVFSLSELFDGAARSPASSRRFLDAIAGDRENPADISQIRLDWSELHALLSARQKTLVEGLAEGRTPSELARRLRLSPGRISQILPELRKEVRAFFGDDLPGVLQTDEPRAPRSVRQAKTECRRTNDPALRNA